MKLSLAALLLTCFAVTIPAQEKENIRDKRRLDSSLNETKPQLYELRCRGGVSNVFGGVPGADVPTEFKQVGERTTTSGDVIVTMEAKFLSVSDASEHPAGADNSGLFTGSCGWIDRILNSSERGKPILFETPANAQLKQKLHGSPVDTSPTAAERYPDAQTIPEYMRDPNHYWSFFGIFNGDHFQASYHKFWKKPPPPPPLYETKPRWNPKAATKP